MVKLRNRAAARAYRKRFGNNSFWQYPPGSPDRLAAVQADKRWLETWQRCKGAAIEAAAGIG